MLDSIYVGMSGLSGFSEGLKVVSNNIANLNTAGYKKAQLQFNDLFYQQRFAGGGQEAGGQYAAGTGVTMRPPLIDFSPGETQTTGAALDVAIGGDGFLELRKDGVTTYTRAGQLAFDKNGVLVAQGTEQQVMGFRPDGSIGPLTLDGLRSSPAKATGKVVFAGNINSGATDDIVLDNVKIIDKQGREQTLKFTLKKAFTGTPPPPSPDPGPVGTPETGPGTGTGIGTGTGTGTGSNTISYDVTVTQNGTLVGVTSLMFIVNPQTGTSTGGAFGDHTIQFKPTDGEATSLSLDFTGADIVKPATATDKTSTLALASQDGHGAGTMTSQTFDASGTLIVGYSNNETAKGGSLGLVRFASTESLTPLGGGQFTAAAGSASAMVKASGGTGDAIAAGQLEGSNVQISDEFGQLITAQRGFQACSRVVTTGNQMLEDLFGILGKGGQ